MEFRIENLITGACMDIDCALEDLRGLESEIAFSLKKAGSLMIDSREWGSNIDRDIIFMEEYINEIASNLKTMSETIDSCTHYITTIKTSRRLIATGKMSVCEICKERKQKADSLEKIINGIEETEERS